MSDINEKGLEKLLSTFYEMIEVCESFGSQYNPANTKLQLPELKALAVSIRAALDEVETRRVEHELLSNERAQFYKPIKPLATRVVYMVEATIGKEYIVKSARAIKRRLEGKPSLKTIAARKKVAEGQKPTRKRIVVRQGYEAVASNFYDLVLLLKGESTYIPNETELKTATLLALHKEMHAKNTAVSAALMELSNARMARNKLLFNEPNGMIPTTRAIKSYVKSVYGASGEGYKRVTRLQFS